MNPAARRRVARALLPVVLSLPLSWTVAGCGGGGGGGGGGGPTGNAAVDATMPNLDTALRSGAGTLPSAITSGTVACPTSATASFTQQVALGGKPSDGTAAAVNLSVSVQHTATGSETITLKVDELGTAFNFLTSTITLNAPSIFVRIPPLGTAKLNGDGTGHMFVIVRLIQDGAVSTAFQNASTTTTNTLINFGSIITTPAASAQATLLLLEDYLIDYVLTKDANGNLVARIEEVESGSSQLVVQRTGGAGATSIALPLASLNVGGVSWLSGTDQVVPVGNDAGVVGVAQNAAVSLSGSISGGVAGRGITTTTSGPLTGQALSASNISYSLTASLNGLTDLNDLKVQINERIEIQSESEEDLTSGGSLDHSLDAFLRLAGIGDLEDAVYLPSQSETESRIYLFR